MESNWSQHTFEPGHAHVWHERWTNQKPKASKHSYNLHSCPCSNILTGSCAGGVRNTTGKELVWSIQTNGLSGHSMVAAGPSGETNETSVLTSTATIWSRARRGGKELKASGGTGRGVRDTMGLGGCTSMGRAAVASIGIRISRKRHGMRGIRTSGSANALKIPESCEGLVRREEDNYRAIANLPSRIRVFLYWY